jgi:uncharacterized coiled-coil DUF342 family protein
MTYIVLMVIGIILGAGCAFAIVFEKYRSLRKQKQEQDAQARTNKERRSKLNSEVLELKNQREELEARVIAYDELVDENSILKRDLQNIDVNLRKLQMDRDMQRRRQEDLDQRGDELGGMYLRENIKWIGKSLTANNYAAKKKSIIKTIEKCRGVGLDISDEEEATYLEELKAEYEKSVRAEFEREEQARIKAQIREEKKREKEIEREIKQLENQRQAIQAALEKALSEAEDQHSEEVERLRERLAEAEERSKRAVSMAEMTKSGHVYVISNIGSFGENIYKIGMTRRLEPEIRVRELSSASVPFPFDVHMMISCDDAPTLENRLHRALHRERINKVNPRKEFFKADLDTIRGIVEENHGQVDYVADPEALEYNQTLDMSEEDADFIDSVYSTSFDEEEGVVSEE